MNAPSNTLKFTRYLHQIVHLCSFSVCNIVPRSVIGRQFSPFNFDRLAQHVGASQKGALFSDHITAHLEVAQKRCRDMKSSGGRAYSRLHKSL